MNKYCFFYTNEEIDGKYTMLRVEKFNGNVDEAERKARTVNEKLGFGKMPGGFYSNEEKDYKNYSWGKIIDVPKNTKIQPYNKHDLFIIDLIERESTIQI